MRLRPCLIPVFLIFASVSLHAVSQDAKPVARTPVVSAATPGHSVAIEADITDARNLYLVVTDGGNGFACDWADWIEPKLVGPAGEKKLTELKWKSAESQWGEVRIGANAGGDPLTVAGKSVAFGIGTHANSVIHYELPEGYTRFVARGGADNGGTNQQNGDATSIQFAVYTSAPPVSVGNGGDSSDHTPENALGGLDVGEGLEATLFAAEPLLLSPSNIDVDHLGRIWVCEVVNYRHFANGNNPEREEGDRILVLEDTNGDGVADKESTFYQGRDIDSAHGVCVLGNRVIVSVGENVFSFYDDDGDLKADRREVLFTGIKGTQHDHGIHSFSFGPDGRLYFNFGNSGNELHTSDGSYVVDVSGREVAARRTPYQEGMVFRCELDGSRVDTLGWNFRNNWEVCVDSFGTLWQSDNDDDGNRGVRINYVMEYGNYGYKDEFTGAGWRESRTNLEEEVPLQHWHLNDPGVVPNLLQTGAGSPTGILVYEGDQLPGRFLNQLIHCDAGPNVVRSYAVDPDGAGYKAEINSVLHGARDQWFRPSDVCVAPDGSLIVADWYDPGVGGHRQGDIQRGRLFRVSLPGKPYTVPKHDFSTIEGAARALLSPNGATRYLAYQKLHASGAEAEPVLKRIFHANSNPRFRARALWLLGQIPAQTAETVGLAVEDSSPDIRITGLRLARRMEQDVIPVVRKLADDDVAAVRRECLIALRHCPSPEKPELWAKLAGQMPSHDRWYLEAIGISAEGHWDECLKAMQIQSPLPADAGEIPLSIVWRSRGSQSAQMQAEVIARLAQHAQTADRHLLAFFRALDFQPAERRAEAVRGLLQTEALAHYSAAVAPVVIAESLQRLSSTDFASSPDAARALDMALRSLEGTTQYIQLVSRFGLEDQYPSVLKLAQQHPTEQIGIEAIGALLDHKQWKLLSEALRSDDHAAAIATAEVMGNSANGAASGPLMAMVKDADADVEVRRAVVRAAARMNNSAKLLIELVENGQLDADLMQAAGAALHSSPSRATREHANRLFPLPVSKDDKPTPSISELVNIRGDAANGRLVFF
ncbi:MAG: NPCBM/NEW2 domain-containing protein, partial [Planctomycetaceae bacterium]|nr:NPCBM/NEW2 domain-containing protein [Planctomycetaceae bacterium]